MRLPLHVDEFVIRVLRRSDAPAFAAYRDDPDVARFQDWPLPYTLADAEALADGQARLDGPVAGDWVQLAIDVDGALAGDVAVGLDDDGTTVMIGWTLDPAWQGRGIATRAARAVMTALWADGVVRIEAGVDPANDRSIALLERLGFRLVATSEKSLLVRGEWVDDALYVCTRPD